MTTRGGRVLSTEIQVARIARQGTVCLISTRGQACAAERSARAEHAFNNSDKNNNNNKKTQKNNNN